MSAGAKGVKSERLIHVRVIGLAFLSLCAAIAGTCALLAHNVAAIALAHLLAAFTGGAAGAIADRRRLGSHFFAWIMAFAMPLYGGVASYFLFQDMKRRRTGRLVEEYAVYLDEAASFRDSVPIGRFPAPNEMISLGDVLMETDSESVQRVAIEYLAEMETPSALEILRKAASTAGSEAYFFSMNALTQMEDRMLARLDELEDQFKQDGAAGADADLLLKTASAYLDFIYYNFVEGEIRQEYLRRAQTLLNRVLDNNSTGAIERDNALVLAGRAQLLLNENRGALKYFNRYIANNPERSAGYLWRAEAWHKLREYALVKKDCAKAASMSDMPQNMRGVIDFWLLPEEKAV